MYGSSDTEAGGSTTTERQDTCDIEPNKGKHFCFCLTWNISVHQVNLWYKMMFVCAPSWHLVQNEDHACKSNFVPKKSSIVNLFELYENMKFMFASSW